MSDDDSIHPFRASIPDAALADLRERLAHFLHVRSPEPGAFPLVLTHGWPGSVAEFGPVIGPLTDPGAHGGDKADAFHLVLPTLPGYGFSGPTTDTGWDVTRIARAWAELMRRLGYGRYGAQGGDWGARISPELARLDAAHVAGLPDSPAGQLAWCLEWFDDYGQHPGTLNDDSILTNVSLYWLTGTAGSAARLYKEAAASWGRKVRRSTVPTGVAVFPGDSTVRTFAEREHNVVRWTEYDRGGHFAAMQAPDLLVEDIRAFFRQVR
jgi:epoxide hydrolase